ncbi:hypothetical protein ACFLTB_03090 [Chloroflexota bacterium]
MHRRYLRLKACPRCGGDILVDRAMEDGEVCIQCGFRKFIFLKKLSRSQALENTMELKVNKRASRKTIKNK